jgi:hypothetical protein
MSGENFAAMAFEFAMNKSVHPDAQLNAHRSPTKKKSP